MSNLRWLGCRDILCSLPFLVLIDIVINIFCFEFFELFVSIGLCGLGLLIAMGIFFVTKWFKNGFVKYLKFNVSLVKGGLKAWAKF